jgi:hypothetical protein
MADLEALIGYVAEELWPAQAEERAAEQAQALPLKAESDGREKDSK